MTTFGLRKDLRVSFDEALARVPEALKAEGFGVLTEIDIQTPIPDIVKDRRAAAGVVFIGCRFHDQMLRTYARQVPKRAGGPKFAIVDPALLTKNEQRFLASQEIRPIALPLERAAARLVAGV